MAVADWSNTAGSNTTVGAVSIAENCSPGNLNNAVREVMAQIKTWATARLKDSGFTMATATLLGRSTASTGAIEEITIGSGLSLSGGVLSASVTAGAVTGAVTQFAGGTAPTGYLECNGTAVSRATYAALFAIVGTTYGAGDGSTTFNLPDMRGEFVRGWDNGRGIDSGRAIGSTQAEQLPAHTHSYSYNINGGVGSSPGGTGGSLTSATTGSTGGTANSSELRPRNIALMFIIKT